MHNLYTLRGAQVRDGNAWAEYIMESLSLSAFDLVCSLRPLPLCGGVTRLLLLVREGKKLVWCTIKKLTKGLDIFVSNRLCLVVYHFAEVLVAHTELLI